MNNPTPEDRAEAQALAETLDVVAEHIKVEHFEQQLFCGCGFRLWHPGTGFGDPSTVQQDGQTVAEAALAWHLAKKIQEHLDAERALRSRTGS